MGETMVLSELENKTERKLMLKEKEHNDVFIW